MTTGAAWHLSVTPPQEGYPWAWFDPNAEIDIPMDITDWLAKLGSTYASHVIVPGTGLQCISNSYSAPNIIARIGKAVGATLTPDEKYPFTYRLTTANGQVDDRTLYFKIREL